jgi:hypothetical protein
MKCHPRIAEINDGWKEKSRARNDPISKPLSLLTQKHAYPMLNAALKYFLFV